MRLLALGTVAIVLAGSAPLRADTQPVIENYPSSFIPGAPFTFELHAPDLIGLTSYNLTLQLTTGTSPPPLTISVTTPPGLSGYPFANTTHFSAVSQTTPATFRISDASSGSAVATAGGNDYLAQVTVTPSGSLTTPITVTVTSATFNDFHLPGEPQSSLPRPVTITPDLSEPAAVPTPAAWLMFGVGGLGLAALRNRLGRSAG